VILLYGFLSLGLSELVVVAIAVLILLGPKNVTFIKPIVKAGYKMWLEYRREVSLAEREMEEMKHEVLAPIEEAEREVEAEMKEEMEELRKEAKMTTEEMGAMRRDLQNLKQGLGLKGKATAPRQGIRGRPGQAIAKPGQPTRQQKAQVNRPQQNVMGRKPQQSQQAKAPAMKKPSPKRGIKKGKGKA
jgi:Sec-independent protein translocase protein TatA